MNPYWWVALGMVPGVGAITYIKLLERFGSPEAVFRAPMKALREVDRVGPLLARAIRGFRDFDGVERELARMEEMRIGLVILGQASYPPCLAAIPDPPPYLYVRGELKEEDNLAVAIVGSRSPSTYGLKTTFRIARDLARRGVTVVSGMARGIDSEAHKGALAGGGRTIAVLGSGVNVIYPPENRELCDRIVEQGAVISEYQLDAEPDGIHFPARNRIISGLSLGVTIGEAAPKSGSLITARLALEQGREIFAVPGSVDSIRSRGTHHLIRQGAHLVESAKDILDELGAMLRAWGRHVPEEEVSKEPEIPLSPDETKLLEVLGEAPFHIDEVIQRGQLGPAATTAVLLQLELKGLVRQLAGKRFVRAE